MVQVVQYYSKMQNKMVRQVQKWFPQSTKIIWLGIKCISCVDIYK